MKYESVSHFAGIEFSNIDYHTCPRLAFCFICEYLYTIYYISAKKYKEYDENWGMWSEEQHYFQGGYDYDFIKELDHRLECSICLLCMRDPYKTSCGHIFCYSCILTWINEGRKCPHDNSSLGEGVSKSSYPDQPYIICKVCQKIVL